MNYLICDDNALDMDIDMTPIPPSHNWALWHYPNGVLVPMAIGDEIEVRYPETRPIQHAGLILSLWARSVFACSTQTASISPTLATTA
jgi:hypothetical protein